MQFEIERHYDAKDLCLSLCFLILKVRYFLSDVVFGVKYGLQLDFLLNNMSFRIIDQVKTSIELGSSVF